MNGPDKVLVKAKSEDAKLFVCARAVVRSARLSAEPSLRDAFALSVDRCAVVFPVRVHR